MTKKEFYEKINGRDVEINNLEQIRTQIRRDYKNLCEQINKDNETIKKYGSTQMLKAKFSKVFGAVYEVNNGQTLRAPLIQLILAHNRKSKSIVRSNDIIVNGCHFNKKDIVILSENTFTNVNKIANYDIIFKIVD